MKWAIDPTHSSIEFRVRHLGIAWVRGRFKSFEGNVELDEDGRPQSIEATIDATSIDTGVEDRDAHLRSPDFFDVENHPTLEFRSTAIEPRGEGEYEMTGQLTMLGKTHPVRLELEAAPPITDPWGAERVAGSAGGKLDRKEWGLEWNQALEAGGWLVGNEVKFHLEVEAVAGAPVPA